MLSRFFFFSLSNMAIADRMCMQVSAWWWTVLLPLHVVDVTVFHLSPKIEPHSNEANINQPVSLSQRTWFQVCAPSCIQVTILSMVTFPHNCCQQQVPGTQSTVAAACLQVPHICLRFWVACFIAQQQQVVWRRTKGIKKWIWAWIGRHQHTYCSTAC